MDAVQKITEGAGRLSERMRSIEFEHLLTHGEQIAMPHVLKPRPVAMGIWQMLGAVPPMVMRDLRYNQMQLLTAAAAMKDFSRKLGIK